MKICFIADVLSTIARDWIRYFPARGHEVHILATKPSEGIAVPGATVHSLLPIPTSRQKAGDLGDGLSGAKLRFGPSTFWGRTAFSVRNQVVRPVKCILLTRRARALVEGIKPDLLHALRIPIEGELGARLGVHPFIASIWGNDLTLHAAHSFAHRALTYRTLNTVDGLLADTKIDLQRAHAFAPLNKVPTLCIPGCGGLSFDLFFRGCADLSTIRRFGINPERPLVLNPRGVKQYVRHDTFFASIPKVLAVRPDAQFVAVGLRGWRWAEAWIERAGLVASVFLTGYLSQVELAELYRKAILTVSPTEHDGTPNSLLEAMACGCLPICGDLPSIREWITHEVNGLLIDPGDSDALACAIVRGLSDKQLRERAAHHNRELTVENANYENCMQKVVPFYHEVIQRCRR